MEIDYYKKALLDLLLKNGLISPEAAAKIIPQMSVANAAQSQSSFPLLDELSPPITQDQIPKLRPSVAASQPQSPEAGAAALQELLYRLFKTQPRNKLREAGLE